MSSVAEKQQAGDVREGELNFDWHLGQDRAARYDGEKNAARVASQSIQSQPRTGANRQSAETDRQPAVRAFNAGLRPMRVGRHPELRNGAVEQ
jgi:hypothetical protein